MDKTVTDQELALLIQSIERNQMITAPKHLKENVIRKSRKTEVQMVQKTTRMSVRVELLLYGLKISAAVVGAIFLLGVIDMNQSMMNLELYSREANKAVEESTKINNERVNEIARKLDQKSNIVSNKLNEFSNRIIGGSER